MRTKIAIGLAILGSIFIFAGVSHLPAEEIYTWTDKDGNLHITKHPPPKGSKLKEVTEYTPKTEAQKTGDQAPQKGQGKDLGSTEKSKAADEAQREADKAEKEAHEASSKASKAVLKAYETRDKEALQERQVRHDRVTDQDVIEADSEAMRAQEKAKEAREKAQKAKEKAQKAQQRAKESEASE